MARTKAFDAEETLSKAMQLFWCKGYHAASMQDIVDCLGLSRSSIYDTFGDKHQLFTDALKKYRREGTTDLIEPISTTADIKATIREILNRVVEASLSDDLHKGCFMVNTTVELAPHDDQIARIVHENWQAVERAFQEALERGQESGQISKVHTPLSLARFLFNTISGIRVAAKFNADRRILEDIVDVTISVL